MRAILLILALLGAAGVHAESYPNRPVKLVVPWPPGQSTDVVARTASERIGTDFAAKSAPDVHARLASACRTVLDSREIQDLFRARGTETSPVSPSEFARFIRAQNDRFAAIARQARIRLD